MNKQEFLNGCSQATTAVVEATLAFDAWLASIASAYSMAWKSHTDFLDDLGNTSRIAEDLIVAAALAFFPGGVGGIVGSAMKKATEIDFIVDGVKDLSKWGLRSGAVIGMTPDQMRPSPYASLKAFPTNPLEWYLHVAERVKSEMRVPAKKIGEWQEAAKAPNATFNFDPFVVIKEALVLKNPRLYEEVGAAKAVALWNTSISPLVAGIAKAATGSLGINAPVGSLKIPTQYPSGQPVPLTNLQPIDKIIWKAQFERGFIISWISDHPDDVWSLFQGFMAGRVEDKISTYGESIGFSNLLQYAQESFRKNSDRWW